MRKVVTPALLEVNGLSDLGVDIDVRRRHARAPIHEVAISWWRKSGAEYRAAVDERNRSKVGRMARLRGEVEKTEALQISLLPATPREKIDRTVEAMRRGCARGRHRSLHKRTGGLRRQPAALALAGFVPRRSNSCG
jgi:hypothetical protein